MSENQCGNSYSDVLTPFPSEEMAIIVQMKRFFEWVEGDPDFRQASETGNFSSAQRDRLKKIGVTFDLNELALLWEKPEIVCEIIKKANSCQDLEPDSNLEKNLKKYPLLFLWIRFISRKNRLHKNACAGTFSIPKNPKFDAWRQRRISATYSELGAYGKHIDHPILALELGDGCSVGCWLCAFDARKLTKNLDYNENRDFFTGIARACADIFGEAQASMTLLYYRTEPHDNPHYLDFVKDYEKVTHRRVCTATAVCTDAKWTRELIAYYRQGPNPWPRFSVLSKGILYKIHDLYSPEELRDVQLLMQMKNSEREKVPGGRILEEQSGMRGRKEGHYLDEIVPQGSIACISGFLTDLVNKTIQLVSPCYTSKKWPYGYRVFDEAVFENADDFKRVMNDMIERNMPDTPFPNMPIRFRDDLDYRKKGKGFDLVSPNQIHHFQNNEIFGPLGGLIASRDLTYDEIFEEMTGVHWKNPIAVMTVLQELFDSGFLDEVKLNYSNVNKSLEAQLV